MAKIYGLFGAMTGKLADTVMSVRNGEQIARKYQPVVFNPSTPAQIAQRAKLKLMSQLSAVLAPVIAIPRVGSVSSRNLFTKVNFGATSYEDNEATIDLASVQLTKSVVGIPSLHTAATSGGIAVNLGTVSDEIDHVVYVLVIKGNDNKLRLVESQVISEPSSDRTFPTTFSNAALSPSTGNNLVFLAYGVRLNSEAARVKFGNLTALAAEEVAKIITERQLTENDITLTETVGLETNTTQTQNMNATIGGGDENTRSAKKKN